MDDKIQNRNSFAGKLYYNFSVLLCLPQSLNYPNSKATGADRALPTFLKYAKDAGLPKIDKLPIEHLLWNFHCVS